MAPSDMLLMPAVPLTHSPDHTGTFISLPRLTALLTWACNECRGSWGQWAVPDSTFNMQGPDFSTLENCFAAQSE